MSSSKVNPTPEAAARILAKASALRPQLAIVLGSGFGPVLERVEVAKEIPYAKLPGFPQPTVAGHAGKLVLGTLGGTPVAVLSGRAHYYEGHSMAEVTFAVRVLAEFGIRVGVVRGPNPSADVSKPDLGLNYGAPSIRVRPSDVVIRIVSLKVLCLWIARTLTIVV